MNRDGVSLKELERRAYRSIFEDGIYDIQFGLFFLIFALVPVFEEIGISRFSGYALLAIPLVIPWLGKRYITVPRMGEVEFGPERKKKKQIALIVAAIILFLTLPLLFILGSAKITGVLGWKLMAVFAAPFFVLVVYTADFPRLYLYAALLFASVVEAEFLFSVMGSPINAVFGFGLPGIVITSIGASLMIKFIKSHPRTEVEDAE